MDPRLDALIGICRPESERERESAIGLLNPKICLNEIENCNCAAVR